ncbi:MAG: zinc-binding alcohol dehydrogenase family protein [Chloroflexota bacterium]|nr:zinc-binding alcohol dehydrogenase family protein [Chloroflexota bacterium]
MTELGESMMAARIARIGKPRALKYERCPMPTLAPDEALVKIHAASANPGDLLFRNGRFIIRKPLPHILGNDLAGEIAAVGEDVSEWEPGERVAACYEGLGRERDGSYAEYCAVPADQLVKMPVSLDFQVAVAAGASFANAWTALVGNGKIKKADRVVIQSAASPLGIAAVQIASAKGAQVIAISGSDVAAQLREIGAHIVLDEAGSDLVRQVKVATGELGATLVLHSSNTDALAQSIDMLDYKGRLVLAAPAQVRDSRINLMDIYLKNLSILGSYDSLRTRDFESILLDFAKGKYQPAIDETLPLSQARKAHEKMEKKPGFGKIVLTPDSVLEAAKKPASWIPID